MHILTCLHTACCKSRIDTCIFEFAQTRDAIFDGARVLGVVRCLQGSGAWVLPQLVSLHTLLHVVFLNVSEFFKCSLLGKTRVANRVMHGKAWKAMSTSGDPLSTTCRQCRPVLNWVEVSTLVVLAFLLLKGSNELAKNFYEAPQWRSITYRLTVSYSHSDT